MDGHQIRELQFTHVIHCAASPGLRNSWKNPEQQVRNNVLATQILLEISIQKKIDRFVHISTSSVYGKVATASEGSALEPASPYGITKLAAEQLVQNILQKEQVPFTILRLFSVYGPGQRPDMAYRRIMEALLGQDRFYMFGDGSQLRTNTYVLDAAAAIVSSLFLDPSLSRILNIGGNEQISLLQAVDLIQEISSLELDFEKAEAVLGDQDETRADTSLAQQILGFSNKTPLKIGLTEQWKWASRMNGG